jgi:WD40 repeat protein
LEKAEIVRPSLPVREIKTLTSVPSRNLVAIANGSVASCNDKIINLWTPSKDTPLQTIEVFQAKPQFSMDIDDICALLILKDGTLVSGSRRGSLYDWNLARGTCTNRYFYIRGEDFSNLELSRHYVHISSLAVLTDDTLAIGSARGTIKLWDPIKRFRTLEGHSRNVRALVALPNGILVSGSEDKTIKFWDPSKEVCLRTLNEHSDGVLSLAVSLDGNLVSGSSDQLIKLWNPSTGACVRTLAGHAGAVTSLIVLLDGILVSGSYDKTVRFWDPSTGACFCTSTFSSPVVSLAVLPDGTLVIGFENNMIKFFK